MRMILRKEDKKAISFLGGAFLAGISLYYYNTYQVLAFVGIMLGAYDKGL